MIKKFLIGTSLILGGLFLHYHFVDALPVNFNNQLVTAGLSLPTDFVFAPDGRIFITGQSGQVVVFKNNQLLSTPAIALNVGTGGDRGLLSMILDPNFQANHFVYLLYTSSSLRERISKFAINGDVIDPGTEQVLLENPKQWTGFLNAGALRFGPDGKLYASLGSDGTGTSAQDVSTFEGKVVRINSDGSIPTDNPFFNFPGAQKSVYAIGLRNPWRFNFGQDGKIILGDVGESNFEKIVRVQSGANYGWPTVEGDCRPNCGQLTAPLLIIPHNGQGTSVVGGDVTKGTNFPATYNNTYFYGDYVQGYIKYFGFDGSGNATAVQTFDTGDGSLAAIHFGPDGCLWYLDIFPGALHKICFGGNQPVQATAASDKTSGNLPLTVNFSSASSTGASLSYQWNFGDGSNSTQPGPSHTYTTKGIYTATLTVSSGGFSSSANVTIWAGYNPPNVTITAPTDGGHYNGGSLINFAATAQDPQDGNLPANKFIWLAIPHHNTHIHTPVEFDGVSAGQLAIPQDGEPVPSTWYEFKVTATDSAGLSSTASVSIYPNLSNITLTTNTPGLAVMLDGQPFTAPHSEQNVVGMHRSVGVNSPQLLNGDNYNFSSWSDSGAQSHAITSPGSDTTFTANFIKSTTSPGTLCATATANAFTGCYYSDMNLTNLVLTRTDPNIAFLWNPDQSPDPAVPPFGWSSSWIGNFGFNASTYQFDMTVDDGARLYIDGQKVIDAWKDQGATKYTITPTLTAGTHTIKMEYYQNGGQAQAALNWKQINIPLPNGCPAPGNGSFTGCYYKDQNFGIFGLSRTDAAINFDWGGGSPDAAIPVDHFSAKWQGNFNFTAGDYNFTATADDGIRVWIDGTAVLDKFIDQPATTYTFTRTLTAGIHLVEVQYYENGGGAVAKVSWSYNNPPPPPGGIFAVSASMPNNNFSAGTSTAITTNITSSNAIAGAIIDTEIYDSGGTKILQNLATTNLIANQQFTSVWNATLPATNGAYTVKIGVFAANYSQLYFWNNSAFQFTIGAPPGSPLPGQTYPITVTVPQNGAAVSGVVEIKGVITGLNINSYNLAWRTGTGTYFTLDTDPVTQGFKHAWIDFGPWKWIQSGIYPLEFQATDSSTNVIGHGLISVTVTH